MLKQSCNQLPDAITRSRIFCDHLSQCAMVVGVLQGLRNVRERAMYSNIEGGLQTLQLKGLRSPPFDLHPSKASKASKPRTKPPSSLKPLLREGLRILPEGHWDEIGSVKQAAVFHFEGGTAAWVSLSTSTRSLETFLGIFRLLKIFTHKRKPPRRASQSQLLQERSFPGAFLSIPFQEARAPAYRKRPD